jgi:hypothetical protein
MIVPYRIICAYHEQMGDVYVNPTNTSNNSNMVKLKSIGGTVDEDLYSIKPLTGRKQQPAITNHNFLAVYFDRRHKDLKLLLNLLAETSGLPESFRILTLFDKKFQSLWKPQNLRFVYYFLEN